MQPGLSSRFLSALGLLFVVMLPSFGGCSSGEPPPSGEAPPIDPTKPVNFHEAMRFIYSGPNARQSGVAAGTLDPSRESVIRGRVLDGNGHPIAGAKVVAPNHPEYGQTLTSTDGWYDFAVNGGERIFLRYSAAGLIEAQRGFTPGLNRFRNLDDVVLLGSSARTTAVQFNGGSTWQLASGEPSVADDAAARTAHILFPPGVRATVTKADGTKAPLGSGTFRVTEYTRGDLGDEAMPGALPPASAYTYASNFGFDETKDAREVSFDKTVMAYVDNFLSMKIGTLVPSGAFAPEMDAWKASESGRVLAVVNGANGKRGYDTDGDGKADSATVLAALGITQAEIDASAPIAPVGKSFFRVPLQHFSTYDFNWGQAPAADAANPAQAADGASNGCRPKEDVQKANSTILCESRLLTEQIPVVGTGLELHYSSERVAGHTESSTLTIPITEATVPASAKRAQVEIAVLGVRTTKTYDAVTPNMTHTFVWDGKDAYGRAWPGRTRAYVRVGLVYESAYTTTPAFGMWTDASGPITQNPTRREFTFWRTYEMNLGTFPQEGLGFGGWALSGLQNYDPGNGVLYFGDGRQNEPDPQAVIEHIAGNFSPGYDGDGGPATAANLNYPWGLARAADGTLYIADASNNRVRKVVNGIISTFAGTGVDGFSGDGGPATSADISAPTSIAVRPFDGAVCFSVQYQDRVRCVTKDGIIQTVLGGGTQSVNVSGVPAIEANVPRPTDVAFGPDGSMYVLETTDNIVVQLEPGGYARRVAGGGTDRGENVLALRASLSNVTGIAVDPDGAIYVSERGGGIDNRVRRIDPRGIIMTVAGGGSNGDGGDARLAKLEFPGALAVDGEGTLYISDGGRIRRVYHGRISTFAGGGDIPTVSGAIGQPARRVANTVPSALVLSPNGDLYTSEFTDSVILRLHPVVPATTNGEKLIVSGDGSEIYVFDTNGRHLRTLDGLTNAVKLRFSYNGAGKLARVEDNHHNATVIGYDANGRATSIVAPFSQTTLLAYDADGYLAKVTDPLGREEKLSYGTGGLLEQRLDAGGGVHAMQYDARGNLLTDAGPENATWTLSRESLSPLQTRITTGLGRTRLHSASGGRDTGDVRTVTHEDGTKTVLTTDPDRGAHVTWPDGTKLDTMVAADPRFGMQSPYVSHEVTTLPSGLKRTVDTNWSARFDTDGSLLGLDGTRTTVDGASSSTYDVASRTWTNTSAVGRQARTVLDADGRVIRVETPGLAPMDIRYDTRGRPVETSRGARRMTYGYDANSGVLQSITDALGPVAALERDTALRVVASVRPDGARTVFGYDPLDNVLALTPPGKPAHTMTRAKDGLETSYASPGGQSLSTSYDGDRAVKALTHEDGAQTVLERDSSGRPATLRFATGQVGFGYDAATGNAVAFSGPSNASISAVYDGAFLTSVTTAGPASGTIAWTRDALLRLKTETLSGGGTSIAYTYDADGLRTKVGPVSLSRQSDSGWLSSLSTGRVSQSFTYTMYGELATSTLSGAGKPLNIAYTYNNRGQLVEKLENGVLWGYAYDAADRLARVTKDGVEQGRYSFDANGNRTDNGTQVDEQDRLTRRGDTTYTYTPRGERATKSTPSSVAKYSYDGRGNLVSVELASGVRIDYQLDAFGRRITRSRNGTITHRWLYRSGLQPVAEVDASGNVLTQFIYAGGGHVPDAMIRGGKTYSLITDHLGSVRFVVDASTSSAPVQVLDYDPWGRVTSDSGVGFQPFGFAGGMYDPDTGLVHFRAREYDPESGTWTSKDPSRFNGGSNLYSYANNDPINYVDSTGLSPKGAWVRVVNLIERKGLQLLERVGFDAAVHIVEHGGDVLTKSESEALAIARQASGGRCPILHNDVHGSHYHPVDQKGDKLPAHVFFGNRNTILGTIPFLLDLNDDGDVSDDILDLFTPWLPFFPSQGPGLPPGLA
ncbi:RHS repeat-associated core domain-containing protein [Pendulispora albinea]|uniref:Uncharacterized protein n=1 Tax=Pendulispora albinea TaxID=2741071 RepID=A0ABZ2MB56_9BACT